MSNDVLFGKEFAPLNAMDTTYGLVTRDGNDIFIAVPENKTVELYKYLRDFGFCFTVDCRGFCEDNVFSFPENVNLDKLASILRAFFR